MVTHIPPSNRSSTSFPFSNPFKRHQSQSHSRSTSSRASTAPYTSSATSSTTTINAPPQRHRPPPLSYDNHRRAPSSSSVYSDSNSSSNTRRGEQSPTRSTTSTSITTPSSNAGSTPRAPPSAAASVFRHRSNEYRPPPSVATTSALRRSNSRSQKSNSQHGSQRGSRQRTEHHPSTQNTFPWFGASGDVEILLCPRGHRPGGSRLEKRFLLHRLILAQNSGFWESEFGDAVAGTVHSTDRTGATSRLTGLATAGTGNFSSGVDYGSTRHTYQLDWSNQGNVIEGYLPILVALDHASTNLHGNVSTPSTTRNKPPPPSSGFFQTRAGNGSSTRVDQDIPPTRDDEDAISAYDNLFRIFYNHAPQLDTFNIAEAYVQCKTLLSLASKYDALDVVGPRVEHHLLGFHGNLWKQVAKYSASYLKLGHLAKSRAIFSEALTHVVGQWPLAQGQLRRGVVEDSLVDLIEDKVDELEESMTRIELKLFRLTLTTSRGERVTPTNGYLDWLAVSLFRQWIAENTTPAPAGILKSGAQNGRSRGVQCESSVPNQARQANRGRIFHIIGAGGEDYLQHDEVKRFLKLTPEHYSKDRLRRFEKRVEELKIMAAERVKPLTRNCLELDPGDSAIRHGAITYLTCVKCEDRDFAFVWSD